MDSTSGDPFVPWFTDRANTCLSKALSRFNDKRGEAAELGVTLVQQKQAIDMIGSRLQQGWRIIKALRKGRLGDVAKELGVKKQTVRDRARGLSALQLEISFGWMPMISDVQNAVKVLNGPFPYGLARGSATLQDTLTVPLASNGKLVHKTRFQCYVAAFLEVDNPGMDVAQRLGLTDPLPVLYEIIPWSFVANWIFNLDEFIGQYNGYHGVKVINPHFGTKIIDEYNMLLPHWSERPEFALIGNGRGESFRRQVGSLPTINLMLRPSVNMPWQRALNAISLLIQKGIKGR
jgi:AraC-like DNA-binding protein